MQGSGGDRAGNMGRRNHSRNGRRTGRGGRGRRRGRRAAGRAAGRAGAQNQDSINNNLWSNLSLDYRKWLKSGGLATNPTQFGELDDKVDLYQRFSDFKIKQKNAEAEAALAQAEKSRARTQELKAEAAVASSTIAATIPDHFAPMLLEMAVANIEMGWERISENPTSHESLTVKRESINFYGLISQNHCQILGRPTKHVQNAHIFPYNNKKNLRLCDLDESDIDDPRNVLRLHRDIEYHFDRRRLTFVPSGEDYILKILDQTIKPSPIREAPPGQPATIGELEGKVLLMPQGKPWRRLLATHSILAHRLARRNNYIAGEDLSTAEVNANELMKFSLDAEAQQRIQWMEGSLH